VSLVSLFSLTQVLISVVSPLLSLILTISESSTSSASDSMALNHRLEHKQASITVEQKSFSTHTMSAFGSPKVSYGNDDDDDDQHQHDDDDDGHNDDDDEPHRGNGTDNYVLTTAGARRTQQANEQDDADNAPTWRDLLSNRDTLTRLAHVALFAGIVYGLVKAAPSIKFVD
jgi:hypothetical protein